MLKHLDTYSCVTLFSKDFYGELLLDIDIFRFRKFFKNFILMIFIFEFFLIQLSNCKKYAYKYTEFFSYIINKVTKYNFFINFSFRSLKGNFV